MKKNKVILFLIVSCLLVIVGAFFKINQFMTIGNVFLAVGSIATYLFLFLLIKQYFKSKKQQSV
jgi:hypothetical protein